VEPAAHADLSRAQRIWFEGVRHPSFHMFIFRRWHRLFPVLVRMILPVAVIFFWSILIDISNEYRKYPGLRIGSIYDDLFDLIYMFQWMAAFLAPIVLSSDRVRYERNSGMLPLLLLTTTRPRSLLISMWLGITVQAIAVLFVLAPVIALAGYATGLSWQNLCSLQIEAAAIAILMSAIAARCTIGLGVSIGVMMSIAMALALYVCVGVFAAYIEGTRIYGFLSLMPRTGSSPSGPLLWTGLMISIVGMAAALSYAILYSTSRDAFLLAVAKDSEEQTPQNSVGRVASTTPMGTRRDKLDRIEKLFSGSELIYASRLSWANSAVEQFLNWAAAFIVALLLLLLCPPLFWLPFALVTYQAATAISTTKVAGQLPHLILVAKDINSLVRGFFQVHRQNTLGSVLPLAIVMTFVGPATPLIFDTSVIQSDPLALTGLVLFALVLGSISACFCHAALVGCGLSFGLDVNSPGGIALVVTGLVAVIDILLLVLSLMVVSAFFDNVSFQNQVELKIFAAVFTQSCYRVAVFGALAFASKVGLCRRIPKLEGNLPKRFPRI
jgi:hypothetical protein